jgi:hypothetical protein
MALRMRHVKIARDIACLFVATVLTAGLLPTAPWWQQMGMGALAAAVLLAVTYPLVRRRLGPLRIPPLPPPPSDPHQPNGVPARPHPSGPTPLVAHAVAADASGSQ